MSAHRAALEHALTRHEHHGRPSLPVEGFTLSRADGRPRRGIHRIDGTAVIEPEGHLHRIFPSPDRRLIAVEWAPSADENAVLGIVDVAAGTLRLHDEIRLRYDNVLWAAHSRSLDVIASRDGMMVTLNVETGLSQSSPHSSEARLRLFSGGSTGLCACSSPLRGTTLVDRATGTALGRWPALRRAEPLDDAVVVWHSAGIDAVEGDGTTLWRWRDPLAQITDVAVQGERVIVLAVAEGRSVLIDLVDGVEEQRIPAVAGADDVRTATMIGVDDGVLRLGVEGPLSPPQIVERAPGSTAVAPGAGERIGTTVRHDFPAGDGAVVSVHVTSPPGASGPVPVILTCYGGFGVAHLPLFEPTIPAWVGFGGAYASAQLRGGGERGEAWRASGHGEHKARTVADLAVAARGLIDAGITRPDLLVLAGASLGGVVAAACAVAHPDLFAGFVTTAAPLDLLALDEHPLGSRWRAEFGDDGTPESHARLRALSPLALAEKLTTGSAVPAYLGIALGEDTRVLARDTHRMVDALQRAGGSARLCTAADAGHGTNESAVLHELGIAVLDFAAEITTKGAR